VLSALVLAGVLAACGLMLWLSYKIEPHWVSKDGNRLICYGQALSRGGTSTGRWRELRINRVSDDTLEVRTRRGSLAVDTPSGNPMRMTSAFGRQRHVRKATYWKVAGLTPAAKTDKRVLYMLDGNNEPSMPEMIAIRIPAKSKAIPMLESLRVSRQSASRQSRGTTPEADQPDRG